MKSFLLFAVCLIGMNHLLAQTYQGQVHDADTGERLTFVSIQHLGNDSGTFSDLDGSFLITASPNDSLRFSYVGYTDQVIVLKANTSLEISLKPAQAILPEIVVRPQENPAWRIIRLALNNRKQHDPQAYPGYQYQSYRKTILTVDTLVIQPTKAGERRAKRLSAERRLRDSLRQNLFLNEMHLWLTETVSRQYYRAPNQYKEDIIANESSMPADITAGLNPIDFQPFGFYRPRIRLEFTRQDYVNPISEGCLKHYEYELLDTLYQGQDTTFIISFAPLPKKYFVALKGLLYINSAGYAIENVIAEPADTNQLLHFRIQQQSQRIGTHWFPKALETELQFHIGQGQSFVEYNFGNRTYVSEVQLEAPRANIFNQYRIERESVLAPLIDSLRLDSLNQREANTYQYWDSLKVLRGPRRFLHAYNQLIGAFASGLWGNGKGQLVIPDLLRINDWEGVRPGLGFRTGPKLAKHWSTYAYAGYGLRDRSWKYKVAIDVQLLQQHDLRIRLSHGKDLVVPGEVNWLSAINNPWRGFSVQDLNRERLDEITSWQLEGIWRPHRAWQLNPYYEQASRQLLYPYSFGEEGNTYHTESLGLRLRWSPREQLAQLGQWEAVLFPNFPVFDFQLSHQRADELTTAWWRIALRAQHEFRWSYLGYTQVHVQAGALSDNVPYPFLFQPSGGTFFFLNSSLQTAGLTEFTNQYYGYVFFTHRFGQLLGKFRTPYSRPELSVMHNSAWGKLPQSTLHSGVELQDLRHLFLESGLRVDNIVRIPYFQLCYIGLGGSAFYRWGAYHLDRWQDNWRFQLTLLLSI